MIGVMYMNNKTMKKLLTIIAGVFMTLSLMAQEPTQIPAGGTWSTARTIINTNATQTYDSLASHNTKIYLRATKASPTFTGTVSLPATWRINGVTVTSNGNELNILDGALVSFTELNYLVGVSSAIQTQLNNRLLKSDTAAMLTRYIARGDTASMLSHYALTSEIGAGTGDVMLSDSLVVFVTPTQLSDSLLGAGVGVSIGDVRDEIADSLNALRPFVSVADIQNEIADSLNVLRPLYTAIADTASMLSPYLQSVDTTAMLGNYQTAGDIDLIMGPIDSAGLVGTDLAFYDGADTLAWYFTDASVDDLADFAVMLADSTAGPGHYASNYDLTSGLALKVNVADSTGGSGHYASWDDMTDGLALKANLTAARLLVDTVPFFVFGGGGGNAGDTTLFTTSTIYGSFYNKGSDTLKVTEFRVIMAHGLGLDTLDVQIWWNDSLNVETAGAVKLNTAALPIGRPYGTTTGTTDTSFANDKIPPGVWVWCKTPYVPAASLKRKPVYMNAQISGYRIPKY